MTRPFGRGATGSGRGVAGRPRRRRGTPEEASREDAGKSRRRRPRVSYQPACTDPSSTKDFVNHTDLHAKSPSLAAGMAAADHSPDIQLTQTRHRAALVASLHARLGSSNWAAARAT